MKIKVGNQFFESINDHTYRVTTIAQARKGCLYCGEQGTRVGNETDEILCDSCIDGYELSEINEMLKELDRPRSCSCNRGGRCEGKE